MIAGLTAGAIAAIVAALVSLPLRSPLDNVFNSATVAAAALIVGILSGLLWSRLEPGPNRTRNYGAALALVLVAVIVAAVVVNIWLERMIVFTVPLAVIVFVLSGLLTLALTRLSGAAANLTAAACLIAAVAVGGGLVTQGDAESGDLALPERVSAPAPAPTPALTPAATAAPSPALTPASTAAVQAAAATTPPTDVPANTPAASRSADSAPAKGETPAQPATSPPAATPTSQPVPDEPESGARYVVGEGSEITFTVEEELRNVPLPFDVVIRTTELSGEINVDGQPSSITVDLHTLVSDQQFRDSYIRSRMFPDHPVATFTVENLGELPPEFSEGEQFERQAAGALNLNGRDVPMTFELEVRKDGSVLNILGRTSFTWEQLDIPVPTARSVVRVAEEVFVQVLVIAERQ